MIQVPRTVMTRFEECLAAKNISENIHNYYKKWLRFYLDFCSKYHHEAKKLESLAAFQQKLLEKGQKDMQRQQAAHAVRLYLGIDPENNPKRPTGSSSASALNIVEVAKSSTHVKYSSTKKTSRSMIPHAPIPANEALKHSQKPNGVPISKTIRTKKARPMVGASWVAQFTRLEEEIQIRHIP
jgi:hypothetical protein